MKNKLQLIILTILLLLSGLSYAQEKKLDTDFVLGATMPELYHLGVRFHYTAKTRLDFNFGSDFIDDENGRLYSANLNHAIYFGKINPKVNKNLWSINSGFSFLVEGTQQLKSTTAYFNLFFATELPIAKKIFIQPELGASYFLFEHIVDENNYVIKGYRTRIIPKYGLNLIMRF